MCKGPGALGASMPGASLVGRAFSRQRVGASLSPTERHRYTGQDNFR